MARFKIKWRLGASDPCPICRGLSGHIWQFEVKDGFLPVLTFHGLPVWNLEADHSLAHGRKPYNCRCYLEYEFSLREYAQQIRSFTDILMEVETL